MIPRNIAALILVCAAFASPAACHEHMHNRLAFSTDKFPWANMDGDDEIAFSGDEPTIVALLC
ncbi:MAG: hypothetical protein ABSG68_23595 [Thermoguttaceae bacterium]|jgi:hypothetical protein